MNKQCGIVFIGHTYDDYPENEISKWRNLHLSFQLYTHEFGMSLRFIVYRTNRAVKRSSLHKSNGDIPKRCSSKKQNASQIYATPRLGCLFTEDIPQSLR